MKKELFINNEEKSFIGNKREYYYGVNIWIILV